MKRKTKSVDRAPRMLLTHCLLVAAIAQARNDVPPSSERTWLPPNLPKYEGDLADYHSKEGQGALRVSINPRKVYSLAELIDIAERNNPETRVAWERARQAAAAVGLSESAYYPFLAASAADWQ
jgi:outer membrane protein TolC